MSAALYHTDGQRLPYRRGDQQHTPQLPPILIDYIITFTETLTEHLVSQKITLFLAKQALIDWIMTGRPLPVTAEDLNDYGTHVEQMIVNYLPEAIHLSRVQPLIVNNNGQHQLKEIKSVCLSSLSLFATNNKKAIAIVESPSKKVFESTKSLTTSL